MLATNRDLRRRTAAPMPKPSLYTHLRTYPNAHVARLTMQPGCLAQRVVWLTFINGVLLINMLLLLATATLVEWGFTMAMLLLLTFVLPLGVVVCIGAVITLAAAVSNDAASQQFELIKTTTLSNWELASGYLWAIALRLRTPYLLVVGGWGGILAVSFVALLLLDAFAGTPEYNTRLFLTLTTVGVQHIGLQTLLLTLTLLLGVRFPRSVPLRFMMPFIAVAAVVGLPSVSLLVLPALDASQSGELVLYDRAPFELLTIENLLYPLLALLPWLLAAGGGVLAVRWMRNE